MKKVYIYYLKDKEGNIRYIGKTINIKRRLYSHIAEAKRNKTNRYSCNWIKGLLNKSQKPLIEIIEICNESNWKDREKYWIKYYKELNYKLCNLCDGGTGGLTKENLSKEQLDKKKLVMSNTFSKFTDEIKSEIWKLIQSNKTLKEIQLLYPNYTEDIHFGVTNGRQWKHITNLPIIHRNLRRKGYTCRKGLFMIRRVINGKTTVVFSSRDENEIIEWLKDNH